MTLLSSHSSAPRLAAATDPLEPHLHAVYALAQENRHVFASPLGPIRELGASGWLPRFVFFGPNTTDASWRLAFLAGFEARDLRGTHSLLHLIESLSRHSEDGYGLNLTFFPLLDVAGVNGGATGRELHRAPWSRPRAPEIALLETDARTTGYHGYIRVESVAHEDDLINVRMRAPAAVPDSPDVELISSAECAPFAVRFEQHASGDITDGPLSIADDLVVQPFELTLSIPATWPADRYQDAVTTLLTRFILRYRAFQAYAQHL